MLGTTHFKITYVASIDITCLNFNCAESGYKFEVNWTAQLLHHKMHKSEKVIDTKLNTQCLPTLHFYLPMGPVNSHQSLSEER